MYDRVRPLRWIARIVAGTNVNVPGSFYSEYTEPGLTIERRIASGIRLYSNPR
ncbi:MAG: hypothetical protein AB1665_06925 [Candidatus Thermoplasmatota archaeon]